MSDGWVCSGCGEPVTHVPLEQRQPCPQCGSLAHTANESVHATAEAKVYLKTHSKHREGGKKVVREVIEGDDYHRKTGKWSIMRRLIDRVNDWYEEIFHDRETGTVIHKTAEPLSEHRHKPKS